MRTVDDYPTPTVERDSLGTSRLRPAEDQPDRQGWFGRAVTLQQHEIGP